MADRVASTAVVRLRSRSSVLLLVTSVVGLVGFVLAAVPARQLLGRPGPLGGRPLDLHRRAAPAPRRRAERTGGGLPRRQGHRPARDPGRLRRGTADPQPRCGRIRAGVLPADPRGPGHGPGLRLRAGRADPGRLGTHHGRDGTLAALPDVRGAAGSASVPAAFRRRGGRPRSGSWPATPRVACLLYGTLLNLYFWPFGAGTDTSFSFVPGAGMLHNLHSFVLFDLTTSLGFDIPRALDQRRAGAPPRPAGARRAAAGQPPGGIRRPGRARAGRGTGGGPASGRDPG